MAIVLIFFFYFLLASVYFIYIIPLISPISTAELELVYDG